MKTLLDLENNECRYPFGDEVIMFCGEVQQEKSSYCSVHHAIAWVKPVNSSAKARVYHGTDFAA